MASLREVAIDLLNEAKSDDKNKSFLLEQVREIALNRDTSVLAEILPDMLGMMVNAKIPLRRFLIKFAGEALSIDFTLFPEVLSCYSFLMTDTNESVQKLIAHELTKIYSKAVMSIVAIPPKQKGAAASVLDPKQIWQQLRSMSSRLVDIISSARSEGLRMKAIRLAESVALFGIPAPPQSHDPRKRRAAPSGSAQENNVSVEMVPLSHQFINKNELEEEAEDLFAKMMLWAMRGGPQGFPFTPLQMSVLGQTIGSIASQRTGGKSSSDEPRSAKAAKSLLALLTGPKNVCANMTGSARNELAKTVNGFLRSISSLPDPDGIVAKLRQGLSKLEELGFDDKAPTAAVGQKRDASALEGDTADDGEDDRDGDKLELAEEEEVRKNAIAALDEVQVSVEKSSRDATEQSSGKEDGGETELASDVAPQPTPSSGRLVKFSTQQTSTTTMADYALNPIDQNTEIVNDIASTSIQRLLSNLDRIKDTANEKLILSHNKLCVRTALSMAAIEMDEGSETSLISVNIIASKPTLSTFYQHIYQHIPSKIILPKSIWILVSFILSKEHINVAKSEKAIAKRLLADVKGKLGLLAMLLRELYERAAVEDASFSSHEEEEDPVNSYSNAPSSCIKLYDSICLAVLSRLLQNVNLREVCRPFFQPLPRFPKGCLNLLKMLMYLGTKAGAAVATGRGQMREAKNRGTKLESMTLLTQIVFSTDENAGYVALNYLLWCTVADDFDIRTKAVALIVDEVVAQQEWAYESVRQFALEAAAQICGVTSVLERAEAATSARTSEWPGDENKEIKEENEETKAEGIDGGGTGSMDVEGEEGQKEEEKGPSTPLATYMEKYDGGNSFNGSYTSALALPKKMDSASIESHTRRCIHLLSQICQQDYKLVSCFLDLMGSVSAITKVNNIEEAMEIIGSAGDPDGQGDSARFSDADRYKTIFNILKQQLKTILPAIALNTPVADVFESVARSDPKAISLVQECLGVLHSDLYSSTTPECVKKVQCFLEYIYGAPTGTARGPCMPIEEDAAEESKKMDTEESTAEVAVKTEEDRLLYLVNLDDMQLRFVYPILSGFDRIEVERLLPRIIKESVGKDNDALNVIYERISLSKSNPPLSKAQLLVYLHRLDGTQCVPTLTPKEILDSIGVCLNREDFKGDVIRDTLFELIKDETPPLLLMRTAILSAQKYQEIRRVVLTDIIPNLIRRKVWTLPGAKVWEGVCHCVKILCNHKDAEMTLRCILSLPTAQLKLVLKIAPAAKEPLAKILKLLSSSETTEVLSGRWAGLGTGKVGEALHMDTDKTKIIKELKAL